MSTITKLNYLADTKDELKDKLNEHGANITDNDTFRSYVDKIKGIYNNWPKVTGEGTEITLTPTRKGRMQLDLKGNTSQDSTTGKNLFDNSVERKNAYPGGEIGGQIVYINSNATYSYVKCAYLEAGKTYTISWQQNIAPASENDRISRIIDENNINLASFISWLSNSNSISYTPNVSGYLVLATDINSTNIMIEEGSTATDYEPYTGGQPSPSPNFPQPIHVVTGNNSIGVQGKNLFPSDLVRTDKDWLIVNDDGSVTINYPSGGNINFTNLFSEYLTNIPIGNYRLKIFVEGTFKGGNLIIFNTAYETITQRAIANNNVFTIQNSDIGNMQLYTVSAGTDCTIKFELEEGTTEPTEYQKYYHADYPINLGSLELCKIGSYQDYLYKENGNWYKYNAINKRIFDGSETWRQSGVASAVHNINLTDMLPVSSNTSVYVNGISDMFKNGVTYSQLTTGTYSDYYNRMSATNDKYMSFSYENTTTTASWKEWLSNNNVTAYYVLGNATTTQITDETLIAQLDAIYEHLQLQKGTNNITVTAEDLAPYMKLNYMQDLPSKLDNLDSRLSLLE